MNKLLGKKVAWLREDNEFLSVVSDRRSCKASSNSSGSSEEVAVSFAAPLAAVGGFKAKREDTR